MREKKRVYQIVAETGEPGAPVPNVTHTFWGKHREEAWERYRSHLRACPFFRGCSERGRVGDYECTTRIVHEGFVERYVK